MPRARSANFTLRRIATRVPAATAAHRFAALQRSGQYSELQFIQRGKGDFDIVGYKWPDKGARRKYNIGRARINPDQAKFSKKQLSTLREKFAGFKTLPVSSLAEFHRIFSHGSDNVVKQLSEANIKFVSKLALNELIRRGLYGQNPSAGAGVTPNQVLFGMRGKTVVGWINGESPTRYQITYKTGAQTRTVWRMKNRVKFMATGKYGKVRNRCPKSANPEQPLKRALRLSEEFHGAAPRKISRTFIDWPRALVQIGSAAQVDYISDKFDGKLRQYFHQFEKPALVLAGASPQRDGDNLLIIKGKFKITQKGIEG